MGKKKLELKYMLDEKKRKKTFNVRKEGLIKKLHEFTTLCDVKACAIIYDGSSDSPEIWPSNRDHVRELIEKYKARSNGQSVKTTCGLSDRFKAEKVKIEEELNALRKKNNESKYPIPVESLNVSTEAQLRDFAAGLGKKIERVKLRIEELKKSKSDGVAADTDANQFDWRLMNKQLEAVPYDYSYSTAVDQMNLNGNQFDWSWFASMNDYKFSSVDGQMNPPSMMASLKNGSISDRELCDAILGHGAVYDIPGTRPLACYAQSPELLQLLLGKELVG